MKKIILAAALMLCAVAVQARTTMKYQALVCDENGKAMVEKEVKFQVTIHEGTATGTAVLTENFTTTTSGAGMAYINIGEVTKGTLLENLDWAGTTYFLEVAVDRGQGLVNLGTQQIMNVPRAIYAQQAQSVVLTSPSGKKFKVTIDDNGALATTTVNQ